MSRFRARLGAGHVEDRFPALEYIRIDTANPPGNTTPEAAAFLQRLLEQSGLSVDFIAADPAKPIVIGRLHGSAGGAPIVLLNHMDVVPADPARWSFPPFSGEIRDGVVYGRARST